VWHPACHFAVLFLPQHGTSRSASPWGILVTYRFPKRESSSHLSAVAVQIVTALRGLSPPAEHGGRKDHGAGEFRVFCAPCTESTRHKGKVRHQPGQTILANRRAVWSAVLIHPFTLVRSVRSRSWSAAIMTAAQSIPPTSSYRAITESIVPKAPTFLQRRQAKSQFPALCRPPKRTRWEEPLAELQGYSPS